MTLRLLLLAAMSVLIASCSIFPTSTTETASGDMSSTGTSMTGFSQTGETNLSGGIILTGSTQTGQTASSQGSGAVSASGAVETTLPQELSTSENCIGDICIDPRKPFTKKGSKRTQTLSGAIGFWEDVTMIDTAGKWALSYPEAEMGGELRMTHEIGSARLKSLQRYTCLGAWFEANLQGTLPKEIPTSFQLWDITYHLGFSATGAYEEPGYASNRDSRELTDIDPENQFSIRPQFTLQKDLAQQIRSVIAHSGSIDHISTDYIVSFSEYPYALFPYVADIQKPLTLTGISSRLAMNTRGDIIDGSLTEQLYTALIQDSGNLLQRSNASDSDFTSLTLTGAKLPLFRAELFESGSYLIFMHPDYKLTSTAEMCKPVVYVYENGGGTNSLQIKKGVTSTFTRLIPDFTDSSQSTWDFTTDDQSQIRVWTGMYEYLYYSLRVKEYPFNMNGWIVRGSDIAQFFADKLPKIGFNPSEEKDFRAYWESEFSPEKTYMISFKYTADLEKIVPLAFTRTPKSVNRVLLEARAVSDFDKNFLYIPGAIDSRDRSPLLQTFTRSNEFDAFEWGGIVQSDANVTIY